MLSHPSLGCVEKEKKEKKEKRGETSRSAQSHELRVQPTSSRRPTCARPADRGRWLTGWRRGAVHGADPGCTQKEEVEEEEEQEEEKKEAPVDSSTPEATFVSLT